MKIIAIANQKGGCGKTTTAVNLSYALSLNRKKTILIDCDPQHHASTALGYNNTKNTLLNAFDKIIKDEDIDIADYLEHRNTYLSVLPSEFELSALEPELSGMQKALSLMDILLSKINSNEYDYVIIDCPPNLGFLTLNAVKTADTLIVPFDASIFSLMGSDNLHNILNMINDMTGKTPDIRYLLTIYDKRSSFSRIFFFEAQEKFGKKMFSTAIRTNAHLREAASCGQSVFEHSPRSNGSQDYNDLALELIKSTNKSITITFKLPGYDKAQQVAVAGDFNNWRPGKEHFMKYSDGCWRTTFTLERDRSYRYKFIIDDVWNSDMHNPHFEFDSQGFKNSLLYV